ASRQGSASFALPKPTNKRRPAKLGSRVFSPFIFPLVLHPAILAPNISAPYPPTPAPCSWHSVCIPSPPDMSDPHTGPEQRREFVFRVGAGFRRGACLATHTRHRTERWISRFSEQFMRPGAGTPVVWRGSRPG